MMWLYLALTLAAHCQAVSTNLSYYLDLVTGKDSDKCTLQKLLCHEMQFAHSQPQGPVGAHKWEPQ